MPNGFNNPNATMGFPGQPATPLGIYNQRPGAAWQTGSILQMLLAGRGPGPSGRVQPMGAYRRHYGRPGNVVPIPPANIGVQLGNRHLTVDPEYLRSLGVTQ